MNLNVKLSNRWYLVIHYKFKPCPRCAFITVADKQTLVLILVFPCLLLYLFYYLGKYKIEILPIMKPISLFYNTVCGYQICLSNHIFNHRKVLLVFLILFYLLIHTKRAVTGSIDILHLNLIYVIKKFTAI